MPQLNSVTELLNETWTEEELFYFFINTGKHNPPPSGWNAQNELVHVLQAIRKKGMLKNVLIKSFFFFGKKEITEDNISGKGAKDCATVSSLV